MVDLQVNSLRHKITEFIKLILIINRAFSLTHKLILAHHRVSSSSVVRAFD